MYRFPSVLPGVRGAGRLFILALLAAGVAAAPAAAPAQPTPFASQTVPAPPALTSAERALALAMLQANGEPVAGSDEADLLAALERCARRRFGQRLTPARIDGLWALGPPRRDVAAEIQAARRQGSLAAWIRQLEPSPAYRAMLAERGRYAAIVAAGGWAQLPAGATLRPGASSPLAAALRARLASEGYVLPATTTPQLFDPALASALAAFQRRHGLEADRVLGPGARRELDVTAQARLGQIDANLERMGWLPANLPADRMEIDVGFATGTLYRGGQPQLPMRVIVGDPRHRTPLFASQLESVVFNPPWNVPSSIAKAELLPKAARDKGYLARNGFIFTANGLQQKPGPKNSLGQIKFDLPSPFGVYLHDTPAKTLFARPVRTLSHGCMRLEKPRELAAMLLGGQGWSPEMVDQAIAAGVTRRVALSRPVPLFVVYRTATIDPDGWAVFQPDAYGWDAKLAAALAGTS